MARSPELVLDQVQRRIHGREHRLRLRPQPLREAAHWLEHYRAFWDKRLDALEAFLVGQPHPEQ